jgi:hypothetical protein
MLSHEDVRSGTETNATMLMHSGHEDCRDTPTVPAIWRSV